MRTNFKLLTIQKIIIEKKKHSLYDTIMRINEYVDDSVYLFQVQFSISLLNRFSFFSRTSFSS